MVENIISESPAKTQAIAQQLAAELLHKKPANHALVFGLQGDLGAGKTTFLQGFANGLGIQEIVNSPTFIIMKKFVIPGKKNLHSASNQVHFKHFYHFDCYRLQDPREILLLGFADIIADPKNIVAIEWPENIQEYLPDTVRIITFEHGKEQKRIITII